MSTQENSHTISRERDWLSEFLNLRFEQYFNHGDQVDAGTTLKAPDLTDDPSSYAKVIRDFDFGFSERLVIMLALAPHVAPSLLDIFFTKNSLFGRNYSEFGGVAGNTHTGFLPTGETAVFILAGKNMAARLEAMALFHEDHPLIKHKIVELQRLRSNEPHLSGRLTISDEYLTYLTTGKAYKPDFSMKFPAKLLTTKLSWDDLVLENYILDEIKEIQLWLEHAEMIMTEWGLGKKIKRGYRALFYGPPGTGKTLTASLIGKSMGLDVYRIDLSQVVSKYIGETEKNMANIFDQAENKKWILFFDEADALFGKRTAANDSKDRHANQEVAYLLQRVEDFPGVVILATNLKTNIDKAFARRFQSSIYFPVPSAEQRLRLWKNAFDGKLKLDDQVDLEAIAHEYQIAGGGVINVLRYCALAVVRRGDTTVKTEDIIKGISREYLKEGKML